jgi:hypothetical protein
VDPVNGLNSDHVLYPTSAYPNAEVNQGNPTVWRCVKGHDATFNNTPKLGSPYWEKADICGKTINSCKIRYQMSKSSGTNKGTLPGYEFNTEIPLPFGGFPGVVKFT